MPYLSCLSRSPKFLSPRVTITRLGFLGMLLGSLPATLSAQAVTSPSPNVNFGTVNLCAPGATTPSPCSATRTLTYTITDGGVLSAPKVVTGTTASPDFSLFSGSTCTGEVHAGATCQVQVKFAPRMAGTRQGGVLVRDQSGNVITTTLLYGSGNGPQAGTITNAATGFPVYTTAVAPFLYGRTSDGAGNVFAAAVGFQGGAIVEMIAGGGPTIRLPILGLNGTSYVTVDPRGDVFVATENYLLGGYDILELPAGCESSACVATVFSGYYYGITADSAGNLFVLTENQSKTKQIIVEVPAAGGAPVTLTTFPTSKNRYAGLGIDAVGDLFFAISGIEPSVLTLGELPAGKNTPIFFQNTVGTLEETFSEFIGAQIALDFSGNLLVTGTVDETGGESDIYDVNPVEVQPSQFAPMDFGQVIVATTATLPLSIVNTGNQLLTITPVISDPATPLPAAHPKDA